MHKFYCWTGRTGYIVFLPLLRLLFAPTSRAYILLQCDGEVLVVKNWLSRQSWQLPGGGLRPGEDARLAVKREISEELGIKLDGSPKLINRGIWKTDKLGFKYKFFFASLSSKPQLKPDRQELVAAGWLKPAKLSSNNTTAEVLAALAAKR